MVEVNEKPFLWRLMQQFSEQGISRFILLTGYRSEQICSYFGDGSEWGWNITYSNGREEWKTGRRLWEARELLDESFFLMYSDNFAQVNLQKLNETFSETSASVVLYVARKSRGNVAFRPDGRSIVYDPSRSRAELDHVEIGYMAVDRDAVIEILRNNHDENFSALLLQLSATENILGIPAPCGYVSVADPARLEVARSYMQARKVLLLDRDGTLNIRQLTRRYVATWEEFEWISESHRSLQQLAEKGFSFVIISNQAGVATGDVQPDELDRIHRNMVADLRMVGATVLSLHVCTDHWASHGLRRKPNPGMFYEAAIQHNIRLDRVMYIGDDQRDVIAARNAGCMSILLGDQISNQNGANVKPDYQAMTMLEAVPLVLRQYESWELE